MKCNACGKVFSVETEGREFVFCPYCGDKHILVSDKYKSLKDLLDTARKNPDKNWELAERLYHIVRVKRAYGRTQKEFAQKIGMSQATLTSYLKAYEFAEAENIDKSRMEYTKAARFAGCKDFKLVQEELKKSFNKDIYTATQIEIVKAIAEVKW